MPFLTFEGIDGAGKSSLLLGLAQALQAQGREVQITREPGGSSLGPELREILLRHSQQAPCPKAELLIYEADRAQHVFEKIRPWLEKNYWVLSDRFFDSSVAFQGAGRKLPVSDIHWLNHFAADGVKPDITFILDLPVDVAEKRMKKRTTTSGTEKDRFEREKQHFHEAVRKQYLSLAQGEPQRFVVLDATKSTDDLIEEGIQVLKSRGLF